MPMLELVFIRHGQTAGNLRRNYVGRTDEPLCEEGRLALQQRKTAGVYPVAELLFCSPMLRCQQTAAIIYPQLQAQTVEELRECNFGDFENQNYQDLSNNLAYQRWLNSNGELSFPGGESRAQFAERCCRGFEQAVAQLLDMPQPPACTAFVVHGGTIMALLAAYAGCDYFSVMCANGGGYSCQLDIQLWRKQRLLLEPKPLPDLLKEDAADER